MKSIVRSGLLISILGIAMVGGPVSAEPPKKRLNPVIDLLERGEPVIGLYAPGSNPSGSTVTLPAMQRPPLERAKEAIAYRSGDFVFDGSLEHDFDREFPALASLMEAFREAGALSPSPYRHLTHPVIAKASKIESDSAAEVRISRILDLGVSGIMFVEVESAEELSRGLAAMRFRSRGGTRLDSVGTAPAFWGMSEQEYRQKADLWPLNPDGELMSWVVIESKEGLRRVREIAAVEGIGVLWAGAGTLRQVFSTTGLDGTRVLDESAWEAAIQQVLAACKEFSVPCGIPARPGDIEMRMSQGFSVFVMTWSDENLEAIRMARRTAGRPETNE